MFWKFIKLRLVEFFITLFVLFIDCGYTLSQHVIRNYDFESFDALGKPISWTAQNTKNQYSIGPVSDGYGGKAAMLITPRPNSSEDRGVGLCNTVLAKPFLTGKKSIRISAYIKTENLSDGIASIWMQLNGPTGIISDKNCDKDSPKGSTDWTQYTIELPITDDVLSIVFGCKMTGKGKTWFDHFEVWLDDEPVKLKELLKTYSKGR